jgi:phosphoadenosine phosphosulfate reductase
MTGMDSRSMVTVAMRVAQDAYQRRGPLASARSILAVGRMGVTSPGRVVVTTSASDATLLRLMQLLEIPHDAVFVDTGYHFSETLGFLAAMEAQLRVAVRRIAASRPIEEHEDLHGPDPFHSDPDMCCSERKVSPLVGLLSDYQIWVTGVRRADSEGRRGALPVLDDVGRGVRKINPLLMWTDGDVAEFQQRYRLPVHPLTQVGYSSIGCQPCTIADRGDTRSGRWADSMKTECGLHTELVGDGPA